jgi:nucleotide-binding universal stress UspA family protein
LISVNAIRASADDDEIIEESFTKARAVTIKDILVHVDDSRAMPGRVSAAAGLAQRHDAHLIGLCVIEVPVLPSYAEAQIPAEIFQAQRAGFAARAATCEQEFGRIAAKFEIRSEWRCVEDKRIDALSLHGRYADLLVVGQADPGDPACVSHGLADRLALESGRPVLLMPAKGFSDAIGENVVVAWNTRREAVRAIIDAMPILETADQVSVITINAKDEDPENVGIPAADIGLHLARHGIKTRTKNLYGAPAAIGELLLDTARTENADLLVMGAYGHARWAEVVLGGVTAHVLAHTNIPTLLAH